MPKIIRDDNGLPPSYVITECKRANPFWQSIANDVGEKQTCVIEIVDKDVASLVIPKIMHDINTQEALGFKLVSVGCTELPTVTCEETFKREILECIERNILHV